MLRFIVGVDDLATTRFGISPLVELLQALRLIRHGPRELTGQRLHLRLIERFDDLRDDTAVQAAMFLQAPSGYGVDFLAPPPAGIAETVQSEIAHVRATPRRVARAEIDHCTSLAGPPAPAVASLLAADDAVTQLADGLERAWRTLLAPDWPQLRALLERDVLHRAGELVDHGWQRALSDLHPRLRWAEGEFRMISRAEGTHRPGGDGLLLVPSAYVWPGVAAYTEPPCLLYPARGVAALWNARAPSSPALARLLGANRARILAALDTPSTTSQLARTLGLSVGGVGGHLAALRGAELVTGTRTGRSVRYRRTSLGDALCPSDPE